MVLRPLSERRCFRRGSWEETDSRVGRASSTVRRFAIHFAVDGMILREEHHSALALIRVFGRLKAKNDQGVVVGLID